MFQDELSTQIQQQLAANIHAQYPNIISLASNPAIAAAANNTFAVLPVPFLNAMAQNTAQNGVSLPRTQSLLLQPNAATSATMMILNPMGGLIPVNIMSMMQQPQQQQQQQQLQPQLPQAEKKVEKIKEPKAKRKKPKDKPKRPLSAYNIFFKHERKRILESIPAAQNTVEENEKLNWPGKKRAPHGKISFENLAKTIGSRWRNLPVDEMQFFKGKAVEDLERYAEEMRAYDSRNSAAAMASSAEANEANDTSKKLKRNAPYSNSSTETKQKKLKTEPDKSTINAIQDEINNNNNINNNNIIYPGNIGVGNNYTLPMMLNHLQMYQQSQLNLNQFNSDQQQIMIRNVTNNAAASLETSHPQEESVTHQQISVDSVKRLGSSTFSHDESSAARHAKNLPTFDHYRSLSEAASEGRLSLDALTARSNCRENDLNPLYPEHANWQGGPPAKKNR